MKRQLWAIIDKKTNDMTGTVITTIHRAEIERIVEDALSNPRNLLRRYPQDFVVTKIAELHTEEEGIRIETALNGEPDFGDTINVADMATKIEIDWHRAAQAEAAEKEEAEAYERWVAQQGGAPKEETETGRMSLTQRIFGRKNNS